MSFKHRINIKEHALYESKKKKTLQNQETSGAPDDVPNKTVLFIKGRSVLRFLTELNNLSTYKNHHRTFLYCVSIKQIIEQERKKTENIFQKYMKIKVIYCNIN